MKKNCKRLIEKNLELKKYYCKRTQDNEKLLPQLKSGFKRKISWNKCLAKQELLAQNANLNYLIEPSFQGVIDFLF